MSYNANPPYTKTSLTAAERDLTSLPSGVLPSGEANFFDTSQLHVNNSNLGINQTFPSPASFDIDQPGQSGLYVTNPENPDLVVGENGSEFQPSGLVNQFSNGYASLLNGITDFTAFNPYIHYYAIPAPITSISLNPPPDAILIHYVSDFEQSETLAY